jgi:hypothetical protein
VVLTLCTLSGVRIDALRAVGDHGVVFPAAFQSL